MRSFDNAYFNIGHLDMLSYRQTFVHRLDPVVKLLVTLAFILFVVSFPKYEIGMLLPFFLFPVFIMSAGDIPVGVITRKLLVVSPFVLFVGIFNPVLDREVICIVFGVTVSGGWVSYASIVIKFILTISSALLLIATTSFPGICFALERLRVPRIFVVQLLFLYRYIFVLIEETMRIARARNMRTFGRRGRGVRTFINITGVLLVRSIERSERIYQAICSRGFDGQIRMLKEHRFGFADSIFTFVSIAAFAALRKYNIAEMIGGMFLF
ncbi:MAG: cobalt ECF transporter T component CbiQ [Nitrospirota bacterium]|nr:cobalt ECF transporter T component CbiQ [Nitrospirota bacterium]